MPKVFISCRRDDSAGYAHAIHNQLVQHFSQDQVFMDVDTVEPGVDFVRAIEKAVGECDVLVALIGKRWANLRKGAKSRLDDPNDFVRLEISTALARDIRVIPVLVDAMRMPRAETLPDPLKPLSRRNAIEISNTRLKYDVGQLITAIRKILDASEAEQKADEENRGSRSHQEAERRRLEVDAQRKAEEERLREEERKRPGAVFRDKLKDGSEGPEMVVVPAGTFKMGDIQGTGGDDEKPVHTVSISKAFAIGRYEITFDEYDRFASATSRSLPNDQGWDRGGQPAINVSWDDAVEYAKWLYEQTGKRYRLPTETEWEYAARAGTETDYWWGNEMKSGMANYHGGYSRWGGRQTSPVSSFPPNPFGLYDTAGNVWEWVQDEWHENYQGAPEDGAAWEEKKSFWRSLTCDGRRVVRGGSWINEPVYLRASSRFRPNADFRHDLIGFRLAQDIE